jgi:hypothetical protein
MVLDASAGGAGLSYGTASPVIKGNIQVSASGIVQSFGTALASIAYPAGAMTDFAIYDFGITDPLRTHLVTYQEGNDASTSWTRSFTAGTAPVEWRTGNGDGQIIWRNAARAVIQVKWTSIANNDFRYVDAVQFEKSSSPSAYAEPRQIIIKPRADRVNFVRNPAFQLTAMGPSNGVTWTRDATKYLYGPAVSGKIQSTNATADCYGKLSGNISLVPGQTYTLSAYVFAPNDTWLNLNNIYIQEFTAGLRIALRGPTGLFSLPGGVWTRFSITGTLPVDWITQSTLILRPPRNVFDTQYDTTIPIWYDGILIEQTSELRSYFAGDFASTDYLWENGTLDTGAGSRSHFYRGYRAKQYRLDELISQNVPEGANYKISYATAPYGVV